MSTALTGQTPAATYTRLLQAAAALSGTPARVADGAGTDSCLALGTDHTVQYGAVPDAQASLKTYYDPDAKEWVFQSLGTDAPNFRFRSLGGFVYLATQLHIDHADADEALRINYTGDGDSAVDISGGHLHMSGGRSCLTTEGGFESFGLGTMADQSAGGDSESVRLGWDEDAGAFLLNSKKTGSGAYRDILVRPAATGGLRVGADGTVGLGTVTSGVWQGTPIASSYLASPSVTVNTGTGLSGGGAVALGGTLTLTNAGVTSLAGTADQVTASASTGGVTLSLPSTVKLAGSLWLGGTNQGLQWGSGGSFLTLAADGVWRFGDSSGGGSPHLVLGSAGASTGVRVKRSGTTLAVRAGDDSGYADLAAGAASFTGAVGSNSTVTGTDIVVSGATAPMLNFGGYAGISRRGAGVLSVGNGTRDDASGTILLADLTASGRVTFGDGTVHQSAAGQKMFAVGSNTLYLYSGTSGVQFTDQANTTALMTLSNAGTLTLNGSFVMTGTNSISGVYSGNFTNVGAGNYYVSGGNGLLTNSLWNVGGATVNLNTGAGSGGGTLNLDGGTVSGGGDTTLRRNTSGTAGGWVGTTTVTGADLFTLQAPASHSGNFLNLKNSVGTTILKVNKDGYFDRTGGSYRFINPDSISSASNYFEIDCRGNTILTDNTPSGILSINAGSKVALSLGGTWKAYLESGVFGLASDITLKFSTNGNANGTPDAGLARSSAGVLKVTNGSTGYGDLSVRSLFVSKNAAPADGELAAGQLALWFDSTNGASRAGLKGKSADGTVVTAAVSGTNTGDQTVTLSGDVSGSGTAGITATLASVITAGGPTGGASTVPVITYDAKGRLTAVTTAAVAAPAGTLTGSTLASGVTASSLTSVGTLTGGATGAGFTVALGTSTVTGVLGPGNGGTGVDNSTGGTANTFWARPNGSTGAATYRAIVAADVPTLNQNTTGSAASLTTARNIYGNSFDGTADVTAQVGTAYGGVPTGTILDFAGFTVPAGYLSCDGTAVSRTTYAALQSALTTAQTATRTSGSPTVTGLADTSLIKVGAAVEGAGFAAGTTVASIVSGTSVTLSNNAGSSGTGTLTFFAHGNGDGSTTFNVPDFRRRVGVGSGGSGTTTLASRLGATGGAETHTLALSEMASHNHASAGLFIPTTGAGTAMNLTIGGGSYNYSNSVASEGGGGAHNNLPPSVVVQKIIKT